MFIPEGYTEKEVMDTMDHVLNQLCGSFRFGYYDVDDMKQEGYIYAIEALPKYKSELSSLRTFLHNHVRNRFINMHRNQLERKTPPCLTCPFYDPNKEQSCGTFKYQDKCSRWRGWFNRNQSKKNLMETSVHNDEYSVSDDYVLNDLVVKESLELLDHQMPIDLRADYRRLIDGATVPKHRRDKVYEAARNILKEQIDE